MAPKKTTTLEAKDAAEITDDTTKTTTFVDTCEDEVIVHPADFESVGHSYEYEIPYVEKVKEYFEYDIPEDQAIVETYTVDVPVEETTTTTYDFELPGGPKVTTEEGTLDVTETVSYDYEYGALEDTVVETDLELSIPVTETVSKTYEFDLPDDECAVEALPYKVPVIETTVVQKTYAVQLPEDTEVTTEKEITVDGIQYKAHSYDYEIPECETKVTTTDILLDVVQKVEKTFDYETDFTDGNTEVNEIEIPITKTITTTYDYSVPQNTSDVKVYDVPVEQTVVYEHDFEPTATCGGPACGVGVAGSCAPEGVPPSVHGTSYKYNLGLPDMLKYDQTLRVDSDVPEASEVQQVAGAFGGLDLIDSLAFENEAFHAYEDSYLFDIQDVDSIDAY